MEDNVLKPNYYQAGKGQHFEVFDVIDAFELDFFLGNVVKYVCRAGKKRNNSKLQDLRKAKAYIEEAIRRIPEDSNGKGLDYMPKLKDVIEH